jgi:hypothetical protein
MKGTQGETKFHAKWTARWAPEKTCLITNFDGAIGDKTYQGTGAYGWDAENKEVLEVAFTKSNVLYFRWKEDSPDVWAGSREALSSGVKTSAEGRLEWISSDEWRATFKGNEPGAADIEQTVTRIVYDAQPSKTQE